MNAVATVLTDLTLRIMLLLGASAIGVELFPGEMGDVYDEEEDDWGDKEHADDFSSLVIVSEDNDTDFK
jgi:hypothetical protein